MLPSLCFYMLSFAIGIGEKYMRGLVHFILGNIVVNVSNEDKVILLSDTL